MTGCTHRQDVEEPVSHLALRIAVSLPPIIFNYFYKEPK